MRRHRLNQDYEDEQLMLSLSDLFAGMIGVTMIFVLFFFGQAIPKRFLARQATFSDIMAKHVTRIDYPSGDFAEAIYVNKGSIRVVGLRDLEISAGEINISRELRDYLSDLYLNRGGRVLTVLSSDSLETGVKLHDLRYELGRQDERFLHAVYLYIHPNLDFVIDEETKAKYRQEFAMP